MDCNWTMQLPRLKKEHNNRERENKLALTMKRITTNDVIFLGILLYHGRYGSMACVTGFSFFLLHFASYSGLIR